MANNNEIDEEFRRSEYEKERKAHNGDSSCLFGIPVTSASKDMSSQPQDQWLQSLLGPSQLGNVHLNLNNEMAEKEIDPNVWYEKNKKGIQDLAAGYHTTAYDKHSKNLSYVRGMPNNAREFSESLRNLGICSRHMEKYPLAIQHFEVLSSFANRILNDRSLEYVALYYLQDTLDLFLYQLEKNRSGANEIMFLDLTNKMELVTRKKNEIVRLGIPRSIFCDLSYHDAVTIHKAALQDRSISRQFPMRIINYLELGDLNLAFNYPEHAIEMYSKVYRITRKKSVHKRRALYKLCQIYTELGKLPEALINNCLFRIECRNCNDDIGLKRSDLIMAKLLKKKSDLQAALVYAIKYRNRCIRLRDWQGEEAANDLIRHLPIDPPLDIEFPGAINTDTHVISYSDDVYRNLEKVININRIYLIYSQLSIKDKHAELQTLTHLSICFIEKAKFNEALRYISNALELANILNTDIYKIIILIIFLDTFDKIASKYQNHTNRKFYRCAVNESRKYHVKFYEVLTEAKYRRADDLDVEGSTGDTIHGQILETYNQKIQLARESENHYEEMYAQMIVGEMYFLLEQWDIALHFYTSANESAEVIENNFIQSCIIYKIHVIYERLVDPEQAKTFLEAYLRIANTMRPKEIVNRAYEYLIKHYSDNRNYSKAIEYTIIYRNYLKMIQDHIEVNRANEQIKNFIELQRGITVGNSRQKKRKNHKDHGDGRKKTNVF